MHTGNMVICKSVRHNESLATVAQLVEQLIRNEWSTLKNEWLAGNFN